MRHNIYCDEWRSKATLNPITIVIITSITDVCLCFEFRLVVVCVRTIGNNGNRVRRWPLVQQSQCRIRRCRTERWCCLSCCCRRWHERFPKRRTRTGRGVATRRGGGGRWRSIDGGKGRSWLFAAVGVGVRNESAVRRLHRIIHNIRRWICVANLSGFVPHTSMATI